MKTAATAFLFLFFTSPLSPAQVDINWSSEEHLEIADVGSLQACADLGISKADCPIHKIFRQDQKAGFTYGELVAAADLYNSPLDLYYDRKTGVHILIRCASLQKHIKPEAAKRLPLQCRIPTALLVPSFLEVVTQNYSHFGWESMKAYVQFHQKALLKAQEAYQKRTKKPQEAQRLLHLALIYNSFADHYLSDSFASGHIRVPRIQLKVWARDHLFGLLKGTRGDILSMILHDNESRDLRSKKEMGFQVQNARGDLWRTRGDSHLYETQNAEDFAIQIPLLAQRESFKELLQAWQSGELPEGEYAATEFVPFHADMPMVEKYTPEYQNMSRREMIRAFYSAFPFYERMIFHKSDFERMLESLPNIFRNFQRQVGLDIQEKPELTKRLPSDYLQAYLKVD